MKKIYFLLLSCIAIISFQNASATIITANVGGGNWNAPGTWNLGRVPACGDTIVVPVGVTVHIPANVNFNTAGCAPVTIQVNGSLTFSSGRKIRLNPGGCMQIALNGTIIPSAVGGGSSELIEIGGVDWWEAADGVLTGGVGGTLLGCGTLLPVELVSYDIEYLNETASLSFVTASEREIDYFIIEISKDGSYWQELTKVDATGTSSTGASYKIEDKAPFVGVSYYRLSHVDMSGAKAELQVISGEFNSQKFLLYPIPVNKTLFVEGENLENSKIDVVSSMGDVVIVEPIFVGDKLSFNFAEIKSGVYFLTIENQYVKKTERIVVVHK